MSSLKRKIRPQCQIGLNCLNTLFINLILPPKSGHTRHSFSCIQAAQRHKHMPAFLYSFPFFPAETATKQRGKMETDSLLGKCSYPGMWKNGWKNGWKREENWIGKKEQELSLGITNNGKNNQYSPLKHQLINPLQLRCLQPFDPVDLASFRLEKKTSTILNFKIVLQI